MSSRYRLCVALCAIGTLSAPACAGDATVSIDALAKGSFVRVLGGKSGGAVLDSGPAGSWFEQTVGAPTVVFHRSRYYMWFAGTPAAAPGESPYLYRSAIGAAVSADGVNWSLLNKGRPVFTAGPKGSFDQHSVGHPFVMRLRDRFVMWYGGADGTQGENSVRVERIGMATSADGVTWTRTNNGAPVIDIRAAGDLDTIQATGPCVVAMPDGFAMWYGAYNGRHSIVAARSADGVKWTIGETMGLGSDEALGPSVYRYGDSFFMLYSTVRDRRWTLVAAKSADGTSWTPVAGGQPVLGPAPEGSFDAAQPGQNHSVHPSQIVVTRRRVRVWYMAEDPRPPYKQRIGLMVAPRLP